MNKAMPEEILATLGVIAAICAFGFGFQVLGWVLACKSIFDYGCVVYVAWLEIQEKKKAEA